ncbi:MAG: helix-turn-helix domain-containing protein [Gemmatimonadota bacterium]|nr:helix-turn-helix domain-containing protein [Gemmatimonadota bacterium]
MNKPRILIVGRESGETSTLAGFLADEPYEIVTAENGREGLEIVRNQKVDLAVVEACVRDMAGTTLLKRAQAEEIHTVMLLVTRFGKLDSSRKSNRAYAVSVFDEPIERDSFLASINKCVPIKDTWKHRVDSFLEHNYSNPELRFEDVKRHFRFSRTYGYRMFKQHLGESFSVRLRRIRLAKSEQALKNSTASISEIAYQCGFASLSTFSRVFKAKVGLNPTTYRRNWKLGQI